MENKNDENNEDISSEITYEEIMKDFIEKSKQLEKDSNIESLSMKYKKIILKYKLEEMNNFINKLTEDK